LAQCLQHYAAHHTHDPRSGKGSLYVGQLGGAAFLQWKMAVALSRNDNGSKQQRARELLESARNACERPPSSSRCSLLESPDNGALALQTAIQHSLWMMLDQHSDKEAASAELNHTCQLLETQLQQAVQRLDPSECEVLYGRAGCLHAILFVRTHADVPTFAAGLASRLVREILEEGEQRGHQEGSSSLMWQWHGKQYLGAAHGVVGLLYTLLHFVPELRRWGAAKQHKKCDENYYLNLILRSLQELQDRHCFRDSGNLASSVGSTSDRLVQWCHGAPGHVLLLVKASQVFGSEQFLEQATKLCQTVVYPRGCLRKGLGLCHGIAGNAYCFLAVYRATSDPHVKADMLQRARAFAQLGLDRLEELRERPDRPYSLYEGLAGFVALLIDLQHPESSCFPCYEYEVAD